MSTFYSHGIFLVLEEKIAPIQFVFCQMEEINVCISGKKRLFFFVLDRVFASAFL